MDFDYDDDDDDDDSISDYCTSVWIQFEEQALDLQEKQQAVLKPGC